MEEAARLLQFERAIELRDQIKKIQKKLEKEKIHTDQRISNRKFGRDDF